MTEGRAATGGRGVDLACEAVGKPDLLDAAARLVHPRGVVQLVGVCPKGSTLPVDLFDTLVTEYRSADPAAVYAKEAVPKQTLSPIKAPPDDYDASFQIEQVQKRFGTVMKSWEGAPARRTGAPGRRRSTGTWRDSRPGSAS